MKRKPQIAWGIVRSNGSINYGSLKWNRKHVIEATISEWRQYSFCQQKYADLSDAQFWRLIKRTRGMSVRRITMRIAR